MDDLTVIQDITNNPVKEPVQPGIPVTIATQSEPDPIINGPDDPVGPSGLLIAGTALAAALAASAITALILKKGRKKDRKKPEDVSSSVRKPAPAPVKPPVNTPAAQKAAAFPQTDPLAVPAGAPAQKYAIGYAQTIGARKQQEDYFGASNPTDAGVISRLGLLAIVSDGIGGLSNGQVASSSAARAMLTAFEQQNPQTPAPDRLLQLAACAQRNVLAAIQQSGQRIGCTLVSVLIHNEGVSFLSIGDSRICLMRCGTLLTLNREHVLGREHDENVALGEANGEMEHRQRVKITSHVGKKELTKIDRNLRPIRVMPGDKLLLMSDGVFNTLSEDELTALAKAPAMQAAQNIIRAVDAKRYPHQDNATIMIVECL